MTRCLAVAVSAAAFALTAWAQTDDLRHVNLESFDYVWKTIRDKYWDPNMGGLDWDAVRDRLRPRMEKARTPEEARAVLEQMLASLKQSHFAILPTETALNISGEGGPGTLGIDVRVIGKQALVTTVAPDSPAAQAGVQTGWDVSRVDSTAIAPIIATLDRTYAESTLRELTLSRAVEQHLEGGIGQAATVAFIDGADRQEERRLKFTPPPGVPTKFGYLPEMYVSFESRRLAGESKRIAGEIGYFRLNVFLEPAKVMDAFGKAVTSCADCRGFILDIRGNPGGIGAMAMGLAGWFVSKSGERLGTLYLRNSTLNFVIYPRAETFNGPLAILVDGASASTSEILAGGLQDLGRAHIVGSRTAGAALPSVIEMLPNGDGFQYAVANYISEGGKVLEGRGVIPDTPAPPTREALLRHEDTALNAAIDWIDRQGKK
jgi:carboxyl-terminal processing protease